MKRARPERVQAAPPPWSDGTRPAGPYLTQQQRPIVDDPLTCPEGRRVGRPGGVS